ncbi:hypothetical protein D2A34_19200 [Clostridium chromiireducens]|uniref:Uncharacterized protein n=1 Tax=Clostridium chromiireducens TaxID=225345 RepID=A0A399IIY7_9CLOT|nr:hypothetical protein [Clostridium chromiireducens]RII32965.1 hypothetical protein D2A34_19200 [Clostridium chromiireducens]
MKIEIGESLLLSWLRHSKNCQLVQTNWKPSISSWELLHKEEVENLMVISSEHFRNKYGFELYKKNSSFMQLLQQAEIDVIGMSISQENTKELYAIDVAFHEAGLNYGDKNETASRVIKKIIRTAMCLYGYFGNKEGEIIFATPKVNNSVLDMVYPYLQDVNNIFHQLDFKYKVRFIANEDFSEKILEPVIASSSLVADTSELFMRSIQMYNLFSGDKKDNIKSNNTTIKKSSQIKAIEVTDFNGLSEMKIGVLVRSILTKMLQNNEISVEEIEKMQTADYSKEIFDIQYPLLVKDTIGNSRKIDRYWSGSVETYGERYFICSEWYETPNNNDRPYFMKWLSLRRKMDSYVINYNLEVPQK